MHSELLSLAHPPHGSSIVRCALFRLGLDGGSARVGVCDGPVPDYGLAFSLDRGGHLRFDAVEAPGEIRDLRN